MDCLTSVFFYPLAGRFPSVYMSVLLAGEAFTGLLASLLATAQVIGDRIGQWRMQLFKKIVDSEKLLLQDVFDVCSRN